MNSVWQNKLKHVKIKTCVTIFSRTFGKLMWMTLSDGLCTYYTQHPPSPNSHPWARHAWKQLWRICFVRNAPVNFFFWLKGYETRGRIVIEFYTVLVSAVFGSNRDWRVLHTPAVSTSILFQSLKNSFYIEFSQSYIKIREPLCSQLRSCWLVYSNS